MQPGDIAKIRTPGSLSLSPDGTRVAFAVSYIEGSAYRSELFVAPTDGVGAARTPHRRRERQRAALVARRHVDRVPAARCARPAATVRDAGGGRRWCGS